MKAFVFYWGLFPKYPTILILAQLFFKMSHGIDINQSFNKCCRENDMPSECADVMCNYTFSGNTRAGSCMIHTCHKYLPIYLGCGSTPYDNTGCLLTQGVSQTCVQELGQGQDQTPTLEEIFAKGRVYLKCLGEMRRFTFCNQQSTEERTCGRVCEDLPSALNDEFTQNKSLASRRLGRPRAFRYFRLFNAMFGDCCKPPNLTGKDFCRGKE